MVKWQLKLGALLIVLVMLAIGLPHSNGSWFAYWNVSETQQSNEWILLTVYRIPEVFIAVLAGMALAVSGLLLQTVLNNPLAGPSILGLTSGSHLFVALVLMGGSFSSDLLQDNKRIKMEENRMVFKYFIKKMNLDCKNIKINCLVYILDDYVQINLW